VGDRGRRRAAIQRVPAAQSLFRQTLLARKRFGEGECTFVARLTGFEWGILLTGGAVVGTLVAAHTGEQTGTTEAASPPAIVKVKPAVTRVVRRTPRPPAEAPAKKPRRATFVFTAERGDSWFQARSGSFAGRILYEGKLLRGETVRLRSRRLWTRFGASAHLDLTIDGRRVRLPAFGTYDALIGPRRVVADRTDHYATAAQSP
jgi:hypothetical protein